MALRQANDDPVGPEIAQDAGQVRYGAQQAEPTDVTRGHLAFLVQKAQQVPAQVRLGHDVAHQHQSQFAGSDQQDLFVAQPMAVQQPPHGPEAQPQAAQQAGHHDGGVEEDQPAVELGVEEQMAHDENQNRQRRSVGNGPGFVEPAPYLPIAINAGQLECRQLHHNQTQGGRQIGPERLNVDGLHVLEPFKLVADDVGQNERQKRQRGVRRTKQDLAQTRIVSLVEGRQACKDAGVHSARRRSVKRHGASGSGLPTGIQPIPQL